jgi:hypothetical protein
VNSIDNQSVTPKNTKITGKKPAKLEMKNKPNITTTTHVPILKKTTATEVTVGCI